MFINLFNYFSYREDDSHGAAPWWHARGDFFSLGTASVQIRGSDCSDPDQNVVEEKEKEEKEEEEEEEEEEKEEVHRMVSSGLPSVQEMITELEGKSAQFTEYSLSSSVVPRNDGAYKS